MSEKTDTAKVAGKYAREYEPVNPDTYSLLEATNAAKASEKPPAYSSSEANEEDDTDWVVVQFPEPGEQNGGTYKPQPQPQPESEGHYHYRSQASVDVKFRGENYHVMGWDFEAKV